MTENIVRIENLTHSFKGRTALDAINLSIPKGKFTALAGSDGAGKTTLIRLMAALLIPTHGHIEVDGFDTVKNQEEIHQRIGYMPQRFGLYEDLTVWQNLLLYASLRNIDKDQRKEVFDRLLKMMGLSQFTNRQAGALSGGMKQKLGLACTLLRSPSLLLLDEPSVGVDPISRRELWNLIQEFLSRGITIVWSTVYLDEAEKADFAVLLNEGKILYAGEPRQFTEKVKGRVFAIPNVPDKKRPFLFQILEKPNVQDGVIQGKEIRVILKTKDPESEWIAKEPRFEDAFIDILGGGPKKRSIFSEKSFQTNDKIVIEATDLTKKFDSFTAVDRVSFQVKSGEVFGLLGPNGAGKSTTFRMLCGLLQPTSGKTVVNGVDLQKAPSIARSHIGYMAQKFSLYGNLSVKQNLEFFSGIYSLNGTVQRKSIDRMIEIFDLSSFLNVSASDLPIGYKQRLSLACALMHHPEVLFLDEPTSGVDPKARREFWNHINALAEAGCTVMVTTHFMDEAEYCDRIGLIYQSKLIEIGTPDELKAKTNASTLEEAFVTKIKEYIPK